MDPSDRPNKKTEAGFAIWSPIIRAPMFWTASLNRIQPKDRFMISTVYKEESFSSWDEAEKYGYKIIPIEITFMEPI